MKTATATMMCTYYYYYYIYAAPYEFALFKTCKYFLDDSPTRAVSEKEQSKKKKQQKSIAENQLRWLDIFQLDL